ncbi:MAG: antibiotic biosynthesis monooxygenase [Kineosporiaceae bacterium]
MTPAVPYLAVIFSSQLSDEPDGYAEAADRMVALATGQPGFLGVESARGPDGFGITISYWRDEESLTAWRAHLEHRMVQDRGRQEWYTRYNLRVAQVTRVTSHTLGPGDGTGQ